MTSSEQDIKAKIIKDIRPWGNFIQYAHNETCTVKVLTVNPNQMLSKQLHRNRDELWVTLDEGLQVEIDDKKFESKPGEVFVILKNTKHRLSSLEKSGRVLEISFGDFDETDIQRFEDIYGRK